jgi:hypothetical protein
VMSIDLSEFLEGVRSLGAALGDEDLVLAGTRCVSDVEGLYWRLRGTAALH